MGFPIGPGNSRGRTGCVGRMLDRETEQLNGPVITYTILRSEYCSPRRV